MEALRSSDRPAELLQRLGVRSAHTPSPVSAHTPSSLYDVHATHLLSPARQLTASGLGAVLSNMIYHHYCDARLQPGMASPLARAASAPAASGVPPDNGVLT